MVFDPNLILYASVSKGTKILAELSSGNNEFKTLALQCLEKTPSLHVLFSHNIRKRIYIFLIEDPFVYFAIVDENLGKEHVLGFLNRLKDAFIKIVNIESLKSLDDLTDYCFHEKLTPIFHKLLASSGEIINVLPPPPGKMIFRENSVCCGKLVVSIPLIEKQSKHSKKKKKKKDSDEEMIIDSRDLPMENMVLVPEGGSREFSMLLPKNGLEKRWWRYVWIALLMDLVVCVVLLGVWLWICRGFKCMRE